MGTILWERVTPRDLLAVILTKTSEGFEGRNFAGADAPSGHLCSHYSICHTGRSVATIRYLNNKHFIETPDPRIQCGAGKSGVTSLNLWERATTRDYNNVIIGVAAKGGYR